MNGSAISIAKVRATMILDDGPLVLTTINATTVNATDVNSSNVKATTTLKADHLSEVTASHGIVMDKIIKNVSGVDLLDTVTSNTNTIISGTTYTGFSKPAEQQASKVWANGICVAVITIPASFPAGSILKFSADLKVDAGGTNNPAIIPLPGALPNIGDTIDLTPTLGTLASTSATYENKSADITLTSVRNYAIGVASGNVAKVAYIKNILLRYSVTHAVGIGQNLSFTGV